MKCVTKAQADHAISEAANAGTDLASWFVVPPPVSAGGDGPESDAVNLVVTYFEALHDEHRCHKKSSTKTISELLQLLNEFRAPVVEEEYNLGQIDAGAKLNNAEIVDISALDKQLRGDVSILKYLSHDDLNAIATNHNVKHEGHNLVSVLEDFYTNIA